MISVQECPARHLVLPPSVRHCPRCGQATREATRSGEGTVVAATELQAPAAGWEAPHRLAWTELDGGGTVLVGCGPALPAIGSRGRVSVDPNGRWTWQA